MNDVITLIWAMIIAIGLSSLILVPLFGLCWHFMKIKIDELKDWMG